MKHSRRLDLIGSVWLVLIWLTTAARAADGSVVLAMSSSIVSLKVDGDKDKDW